ncbi:hypothetical protein E4U55_003428 [Claviceps digitariae]|nr:hypothetical protein E4U55_003428 [Claviceps digitariae]
MYGTDKGRGFAESEVVAVSDRPPKPRAERLVTSQMLPLLLVFVTCTQAEGTWYKDVKRPLSGAGSHQNKEHLSY